MRLSMRVEIARLHRRLGTTMIYVTHDQIEAMTLGQRIVVLKDGVIQQIDTPMRLYREPVNLFVAEFLGSPAMNTLRGIYRAAGSGSIELSADTRIALGLAPATQARLAAYDGRKMVLGLRPEQLRLADAATPRDWPRCTAQVDVVEPVGSEVFVEMRWGACALTARLAPDCLPAVGDHLELGFDPTALHFFDAESEQRIALQ
jgi:multiple sugar transport system ATP-binding protein